ncbi:hypothetical protein EVAR_56936_1 [Eumeta japonica]|uniref:Uncharacterized protein n=1 Tax=Eumeta variegata TaxID=151549 RepID=A0A4C1YG83_EUMVA|nr:hypothetical protein EVAR_56936_1 [Eumeta japonica]
MVCGTHSKRGTSGRPGPARAPGAYAAPRPVRGFNFCPYADECTAVNCGRYVGNARIIRAHPARCRREHPPATLPAPAKPFSPLNFSTRETLFFSLSPTVPSVNIPFAPRTNNRSGDLVRC